MTRIEFTTQLLKKAAAEPAFREHLKQHPHQAIAEAFGLTIPPEVEIIVFEEAPQRVCLVLPTQRVEPSEGQLADTSLEDVSGGGLDPSTWRFSPWKPK